jgi:putative IMPACT (imprinted ancient) family translation regulator
VHTIAVDQHTSTPAHQHTSRRIVNRARFACTLYRAADESQARERIAAHREAYWIASYNCAAYVLDGGSVEYWDGDGEPFATAGAPMLAALRGRGLTGVLAVVTVDFAGVDFDADDRASVYGAMVSRAIDEAGTVPAGP